MTTPDVPLRLELRFEMPGTPEQVWHAIATGPGLSSWFMPTDLEGRVGGALVTHMGDTDAHGTVTGWEPPRRLAYEEDWATLCGHPGAPVTPLATEFVVEARSGGTCVVRVVSSAFGTGADWEREFFADMEWGWIPFFEHLRLYLATFPGQVATLLEVGADVPGPPEEVWATMCRSLAVEGPGQPVALHGLSGEVHRLGDRELLVRLTGPGAGFLSVYAYRNGGGGAAVGVRGYLFGGDAADVVARQRPMWQAWLDGLAAAVG